MKFSDNIKAVGHLEIIKVHKSTKKEEVVYSDDNVICSGLGRSITQMMSNICDYDPCDKDLSSEPKGCKLQDYQILRFQVGTGADAGTASASSVSLSRPLTLEEYGQALISIAPTSGVLYKTETDIVAEQTFCRVREQDVLDSKLITAWVLDEETANGQLLDEAGLFVFNPYLKEEPGHFLAAYKQHTPIQKENYFSLLYRWSIKFVFENEYTVPPPPGTGGGFSSIGGTTSKPGPGVSPVDPGPPPPVDPPGAPVSFSGFGGDAAYLIEGATGGYIELDWSPVSGDAGVQYVVTGYQVGNSPGEYIAPGENSPYAYIFETQVPVTELSGYPWSYGLAQRFAVRTLYYASSDPSQLLHSEWSDEITITPERIVVPDEPVERIDNQILANPSLASEVQNFNAVIDGQYANFTWTGISPPGIFTNYVIAWRPGVAGGPGQYFSYVNVPSGVTEFSVGPFPYDPDFTFAMRIEDARLNDPEANPPVPSQFGPWTDEITLEWDNPPPPPDPWTSTPIDPVDPTDPIFEQAPTIYPPANFTAGLAIPNYDTIRFEWDVVNTTTYPMVTGYEISAIVNPGEVNEFSRFVDEIDVTDTSIDLPINAVGVTVQAYIRSAGVYNDEIYYSDWSPPATATTTDPPAADPMNPATIVSAKSYTNTTINIEWLQYPGDISGYNLFYTSSLGTTPNTLFAEITNPNKTNHRWQNPPGPIQGVDLEFAVQAVSSTGAVSPLSAVSITSGIIDGDWSNFVSGTFDGESDLPSGYKVPGATFDYLIDMTDTDKWRVPSTKGAMHAAANYYRYRVDLPSNHPEYIRRLNEVSIGVILPAETVNGLLKFTGYPSNIDSYGSGIPVERCYFDLSSHAPGETGISVVDLHFVAPWCTNDINDDLETAEQKVRDNPDTQCNWTYKRTFKVTPAEANGQLLEGMAFGPAGQFSDIEIPSYAYSNVRGSMHFWCFDVEVATELGIRVGASNNASQQQYSNGFSTQFHLMKLHQDGVSPRARSVSNRPGGEPLNLEDGTSMSIIGSYGFDCKFSDISILGAYIDLPYQRNSAISSFYNHRADRAFRNIKFRRAGGAAIELVNSAPPEPLNNNQSESAMPLVPNVSGTTQLSGLRHWDSDSSLSGNLCRNFAKAQAHIVVKSYQDDVVMTDCKFIETRDDDTAEEYIWPPGVTSGDIVAADINDGPFSRTFPAILWGHGENSRPPTYGSSYPQENYVQGQLTMRDCLFYSKKLTDPIVKFDSGPNFDISGCGFFTAASGADVTQYEVPFDQTAGTASETLTGASVNLVEVATNGNDARSTALTIGAFNWRDNCTAAHVTDLTGVYGVAAGDIGGAPELQLANYNASGSPTSGTITFSDFIGEVGQYEGQMPSDLIIGTEDPREEEPPPPEGLIDAIALLQANASEDIMKHARVNELKAQPFGGTGRDDKRTVTQFFAAAPGYFVHHDTGYTGYSQTDFLIVGETGPGYLHGAGTVRLGFWGGGGKFGNNQASLAQAADRIEGGADGPLHQSTYDPNLAGAQYVGPNIRSMPPGAVGNTHLHVTANSSGLDLVYRDLYFDNQHIRKFNAPCWQGEGVKGYEGFGFAPDSVMYESDDRMPWWDPHEVVPAGQGLYGGTIIYGFGGDPNPPGQNYSDTARPGRHYFVHGVGPRKIPEGARVTYDNITLDGSWGIFRHERYPHVAVDGYEPIKVRLYGWTGGNTIETQNNGPCEVINVNPGNPGSYQASGSGFVWVGPNGELPSWVIPSDRPRPPQGLNGAPNNIRRPGYRLNPNEEIFEDVWKPNDHKWKWCARRKEGTDLVFQRFHSIGSWQEHTYYVNMSADLTLSASTFVSAGGQCFQLQNRPTHAAVNYGGPNFGNDENMRARKKRTIYIDDCHFIEPGFYRASLDTFPGGSSPGNFVPGAGEGFGSGSQRSTALQMQSLGGEYGADVTIKNSTIASRSWAGALSANGPLENRSRSLGLINSKFERDNRAPKVNPYVSGTGTPIANRNYRTASMDTFKVENCLLYMGTSNKSAISINSADLIHLKDVAMVYHNPRWDTNTALQNPENGNELTSSGGFLEVDDWAATTSPPDGSRSLIYGQSWTRRIILENVHFLLRDHEYNILPNVLSNYRSGCREVTVYCPLAPPGYNYADGSYRFRATPNRSDEELVAEYADPSNPARYNPTANGRGNIVRFDAYCPNAYKVIDITYEPESFVNGEWTGGGRADVIAEGPGSCPPEYIHVGRYDKPGLNGTRLNPVGP